MYSRRVVTWPEALERIEAAGSDDLDIHRRRFGGFARTPLVVAGNSGAGKTRIWCRLTGRSRPDASSLTTDDGYVLTPQHRILALTTIPGQLSRSRFYAMEEFFGARTTVAGVIFVACNGRDRIWHQNADLVANELPRFDMETLIERNRREELANFREVCDRIIQKYFIAPRESCPKWLLVVVNKLDLYWNYRKSAADFYRPGSGSPFDNVAQELLTRLGTTSLSYFTLPVAAGPANFNFDSSRGHLERASKLSYGQCSESMACLMETLGELCEQSARR